MGYEVARTNVTDPQQKDWDLVVTDGAGNRQRYEVKTATLGSQDTFQHENIDRQRRYDGLILVDISPASIYLTCVPKHKLEFDKMHRRKDSVFYKWDFRLSKIADREVASMADFTHIFVSMFDDIEDYKRRRPSPDEL